MSDIKKITKFQEGILYSVVIIQAVNDQPGMAADLLRVADLANADCSELDDYDKEHLRIVNKERGINLTGLD